MRYNRTVSVVSFSVDEGTIIFGAKIIVYRVLLLNYKFFILLQSPNSIHIPHYLPQNHNLLSAVVTKWVVLNVPFKAISCGCGLNFCLYSTQFS